MGNKKIDEEAEGGEDFMSMSITFPTANGRCLGLTSLVALGALALSLPARSDSLVGDTVQSVFQAPSLNPGDNLWDNVGGATTAIPIPAVVGAGLEYSLNGVITADFWANTLSIRINGTGVIGDSLVYDFTDLDWTDIVGVISNVSITHNDFAGLTFSFGPDSLHVEIPNQQFSNSRVDFLFEAGPGSEVPESSSIAGLILGLGGLAAYAHRRSRCVA